MVAISHFEHVTKAVQQQIAALQQWQEKLDTTINEAVNEVLACKGRLIISGVGKSGLIGKKIVATLASTGTPSFFLHPTEAFHGDLGMIMAEDVLLLISYSGETDEVNKLIPSLKRFGNRIISMSGNLESTLAKHSDIALSIQVDKEICPNNLAPTASTLVTLALGDALAVALMQAREFKPEDFAKFHPGGSLGRKLLCKVSDEMQQENLPFIEPESRLADCLLAMTSSKTGVAIVGDQQNLYGIITDGDIRRALLTNGMKTTLCARDLMSSNPHTVRDDEYIVFAEKYLQQHKIHTLVVQNDKQEVVGLFEQV